MGAEAHSFETCMELQGLGPLQRVSGHEAGGFRQVRIDGDALCDDCAIVQLQSWGPVADQFV